MSNPQKIIDVHSHIHFPEYDKDREKVIKNARKTGIKMVTVGVTAADSEKAISLAREYPEDIWATVGFHPNDLNKETMEGEPEIFNAGKLLELAKEKKVIAIGECGLEYYRLGAFKEDVVERIKKTQKQAFAEQMEIAKALNKPLMIHCRPTKGTDDSNEDIFEILKSGNKPLKIIMHFYSGSLDMAKNLAEFGCYFSFGGVITFTMDKDEILKYLPMERILLETDAPYVAPDPYRGKRNEPVYILKTAERLAQVKNYETGAMLEKIYENSLEVFDLDEERKLPEGI
ncbi:MAG: TatD family hydrolase [Candidatus Pacebacteria bacterium]|nr:TatD family hydrolase [Candidatus Paceibacterota bacterium]